MKIKCNDGKVRNFSICKEGIWGGAMDSKCMECGYNFSVHDTKILKPEWKKHICNR